MEMNNNSFINDLVNELFRVNRDNEFDIAFMIAPIVQDMSEGNCEEFTSDITTCDYNINYYPDDTGGYTNGYLEIYLIPKEDEEDDISWLGYENCSNIGYVDYHYKIEFLKEYNTWDEDDWVCPKYKLEKIIHMGTSSWRGVEQELNEFVKSFYKENEELAKEKEALEKAERIDRLKVSLEEIQKELAELTK